ncbi:hypothetical protein PSPO01_05661 [Paraphaeosphaeria sporulosa]
MIATNRARNEWLVFVIIGAATLSDNFPIKVLPAMSMSDIEILNSRTNHLDYFGYYFMPTHTLRSVPDLHRENIFVAEEGPGIITPIIDWQSSSIEPAFWPADEVPGLVQHIPDPPDKDPNEPKREACAKVFVASIQLLTPKLATARSMDEALFRPFRYR